MEITKGIVQNLLHLIGAGIQTGAGVMEEPGTFCIQQAVSMAAGNPAYNDGPTFCVKGEINAWGVAMNDQGWKSPTSRAKGMKRFAVAELGSNHINFYDWEDKLIRKWNTKHPSRNCSQAGEVIGICQGDEERTEVCNMAAEALTELGSEGSQWLYLCDPSTPQAHKDAMNRIFNPPMQLTWRNFGAQSEKGHTRHFA